MANESGSYPKGSPSKKGSAPDIQRQDQLRKGLIIAGWVGGGILAFLLVGMLFGEALHPFMSRIGLGWLYNAESGVYADCSKSYNKHNPYCNSRRNDDTGWKSLSDKRGGSNPFSLQ